MKTSGYVFRYLPGAIQCTIQLGRTACFVTLAIFIFMAGYPSYSPAQGQPQGAETEYGVIEYLFNQGEAKGAVEAGLRFIYLYPDNKYADKVRLVIGKSYLKERNYHQAIRYFQDLSEAAGMEVIREEAGLWLCEALMEMGDYSEARRSSEDFLKRNPDSPRRAVFGYQKGWALLKEWRWNAAQEAFRDIGSESALSPAAQEMAYETERLKGLQGKSPFTAGLLSGLIPGAGYMYIGKWQTGIMALLVNGAFVGGSIECFDQDLPFLGSIIGIIGLGWYSGTVYGSVNGARRYNIKMRDDRIESLNQRLGLKLLQMQF